MKNSLKKATKVALMLLFLNIGFSVAQPYGQLDYTNLSGINYRLSKGLYSLSSQPGYVMAGYVSNSGVNNPSFVIYKTLPGGFISGINSWANGYNFQWFGPNCNSTQSTVISCGGIEIIESTISLPQSEFIVAMANNDGLYFGKIMGNGIPSGSSKYYPFPNNISSVTKPKILETSAGDFIICGSYSGWIGSSQTTFMYILKVDPNGNTVLSQEYNIGAGTSIYPTDLIESPYNNYYSNEFVVVGNMQFGPNTQGFLLVMDENNFLIGQFSEYGAAAYGEKIGGITISNSTGGYAISGMSVAVPGGTIMAPTYVNVKQDGVTNNFAFYYPKNQFGTVTSANPLNIIERPNNYASQFDIFILENNTNGTDGIIKLDPSGSTFSVSGNTLNDYIYSDNGTSILNSMSYKNTTGIDEGIHCYGNTSSGGFYLVQSYFNGECDCSSNSTLISQPIFSTSIGFYNSTQNLSINNGPTDCNSNLVFQNQSISISQICGGGASNPNGNNSKLLQIESVSQLDFNVSPTLISEFAVINCEKVVHYKIFDLTGNIIKQGDSKEKIDLSDTQNGLYILKLYDSNSEYSTKIIVNH